MLKQDSIYLIKVCGCDLAAFRGAQLKPKGTNKRDWGGWLELKLGNLMVDAYVYLAFDESGNLDSERSFAELLEKLPSKEQFGSVKIHTLEEIMTTPRLLLECYMKNYAGDERVREAEKLRKMLTGETEPPEGADPDWRRPAALALAHLDGECIAEALLNLYPRLYQ